MFNMNQIEVTSGTGVDLGEIRIFWELDGPPGKSPVSAKTVFDGRNTFLPGHAYGWNYFSVWKGDKLLNSYSHYKTNNWYSYSYYFRIFIVDGVESVNFYRVGP